MSTIITRLLAGAAGVALVATPLAGLGPVHAAGSVPSCTNADLKASYHRTDAGAGHRFGRLVLTNRSSHSCRTGGYAGLSYVGGGNGTQIGAPADRVDPSAVAFYVVAPGQRLRSAVDEVVAQNYPKKRCHPAHVDGFRVYVPNSFTSQVVPHATTGCRNPAIHLISEKPLRRP